MIADLTLPGVLSLAGPTGTVKPLLLDSPHSGTRYPDDFRTIAPRATLLSAVDTAVDRLFDPAPGSGLTMLRAHFPRTYIDPNRAATDIDPEMLDQPWPGTLHPTGRSARGNGLIRRSLGSEEIPLYDRPLTVDEVMNRIRRYHRPYHGALADAHRVLHRHFGTVYHLNCHSMRSRNRDDGKRRPDIELGDRNGTTCEPEFTDFAARSLDRLGYEVHTNRMFRGAEIVRAFSEPDNGHHCLQIEINKDLYLDEATNTLLPAFRSLRADLLRFLERLAEFAAERAGARQGLRGKTPVSQTPPG